MASKSNAIPPQGNPKASALGVDPDASEEESKAAQKAALLLMIVMYKGKVLVLGILVKIVFRLALPIELRTWANPWAALMSSCFWDTIICAVIMEQVPPLSPSTLLHAL
jgi:hypothetical protein